MSLTQETYANLISTVRKFRQAGNADAEIVDGLSGHLRDKFQIADYREQAERMLQEDKLLTETIERARQDSSDGKRATKTWLMIQHQLSPSEAESKLATALIEIQADAAVDLVPPTPVMPVVEPNPNPGVDITENVSEPVATEIMPSPLDGALMMARYGIPQIPLKPRTKQAFLAEWPVMATVDETQIRGWAAEYPDCNFGSVAKKAGYFVFEIDSPDVVRRFAQTGETFTANLTIRSRPGRGHCWYRQPANPLDNIGQAETKHNDFSLRANDEYCVSPYSIHPVTGQPYMPLITGTPAVPTEGEINFWLAEKKEKVQTESNPRPTISVAQPDGSLKFEPRPPDPAFKELFDKVGWRPLERRMERMSDQRFHGLVVSHDLTYCPMPGHQPRREDLHYTRIFGAYDAAGTKDCVVHCFGCGFTGDLVSTVKEFDAGEDGGHIEYANMYDCARAICKEEGLNPDECFPQPTVPTPSVESDSDEENFDDKDDERFPDCPIFTGALTDLARALFPSLPLEFKQWGLITRWGLMRSGIDTIGFEKHLQPRFYTVLVCPPNRGKTASINETREAMRVILEAVQVEVAKANNSKPTAFVCADIENLASADSGPFLVQEFFDKANSANDRYIKGICSDNSTKILLDPDELSDVFEKARTTNGRVATLFIELLKLHSKNRTGSGTRRTGNRPVEGAHLAILAGTTTGKYPTLWTGTGGDADGLVSRFIPVTTNNLPVPAVPLPSDLQAAQTAYERLARLAQMAGQTITWSDEAGRMLTEWSNSLNSSKKSTIRVLETIKQLLIVLAVVNAPADHKGTSLVVGPDLMAQALKFGDYVVAARDKLNPGDSWSHVQAMENAIIEWAKKHVSKKEPKTMREFRRGVHPERKPGGLGAFSLAWRNCVTTQVLKLRDQSVARYSL